MTWSGRTSELHRPPIAKVNLVAAELAAQGRDLVDLGQAILGLPPPVAALDGAREYLRTTKPHSYSPDPGVPELREALAAHLRTRKNVPAAGGANVMVTCGANQAFANVLFAVSHAGDDVLTFGPGYFDHDYTIAMAGCRKVEVPLAVRDDRFVFDIDAVERALTERTRCVVLVCPGNPTGAVAPESFVRSLVDLCKSRGLWLISDETYDLLTFPPARHVSPASISDYDRIAVLGSFSKIFAMAGWRIGYLAGSTDLVDETFKVQDAFVICAPVPGQLAVLRALAVLDDYVAEATRELTARRDELLRIAREWKAVTPLPGEGATFFLVRIHGESDDITFCEDLVQSAGVVAVPGSAFGPLGKGMVRMSFGNQPVERIHEAGRRLLGS
jgi:aspartate/methionine/tyrosine aminotransferase